MDGKKHVAALSDWITSEQGERCLDTESLGLPPSQRQYIANRLSRAFDAGIAAGEKAERERLRKLLGLD